MLCKANPADDASWGLSAQDLLSDPRWLSGPDFLWKAEIGLTQVEVPRLSENDPEVRKVRSLATQVTAAEMRTIPQRLEYFFDWHHVKRAIAVCRKFLKRLKGRRESLEPNQPKTPTRSYQPPNVNDLRQAEVEILKAVQVQAFPDEIELLRRLKPNPTSREDPKIRKASLRKNSALFRLDPFLDNEGIL